MEAKEEERGKERKEKKRMGIKKRDTDNGWHTPVWPWRELQGGERGKQNNCLLHTPYRSLSYNFDLRTGIQDVQKLLLRHFRCSPVCSAQVLEIESPPL